MKFQIISFLFKIAGLVLCFLFWNETFFWWTMTPFLVLFVLFAVLSSYRLNWNMHIESIHQPHQSGILLTFDDGPVAKNTSTILDVLKEHGIKAVFFVIGKQAEQHPEIIKRIHKEGHAIGNHSYSHSNVLPFFRSKKLRRDFEKCEKIIQELTGKKPLLVRPPFGATSPRYFKAFKKKNYQSIGWNVRTLDAVANDKKSFFKKALNKVRPHEAQIMLLHDSKTITAQHFSDLVNQLKNSGVQFLTPQKALNTEVYEA